MGMQTMLSSTIEGQQPDLTYQWPGPQGIDVGPNLLAVQLPTCRHIHLSRRCTAAYYDNPRHVYFSVCEDAHNTITLCELLLARWRIGRRV